MTSGYVVPRTMWVGGRGGEGGIITLWLFCYDTWLFGVKGERNKEKE